MNAIVSSIRGEYVRYKALAEGAVRQLSDAELVIPGPGDGNSVATICWHVGGNLLSRFTDFLTSDGEKPWRKREEEFARRTVRHDELLAHWDRGWTALMLALDSLSDEDLSKTIHIRSQPMLVHEALHRSLSHVSYHVGQIVYQARGIKGKDWRFLSI